MRLRWTGLLLVGAALAFAVPAVAQPPRQNVIWARAISPSATITLDGVLGEPEWALAESALVRYGKNNGDPGSGYKEEGGRLAKDSTFARVKFLRQGNQLYMAVTCRDSSVGGSKDFNRFDGFLMAMKDHRNPFADQNGPIEYLYSWWHPEDTTLNVPGAQPGFRGEFGEVDTIPRPPAKIAAWDAFTKVRGGLSHSDADVDSGYTVEMRFDMGVIGYDFTDADGDIGEFNLSIYDTDWYWPLVGARFSANRGWWQGPWGNAMWYDEVRIHGRDDVTVTSGAAPAVGGEYIVKNLGTVAPPVIDGFINDAVWSNAPSFDIRYGDFVLRDTYPSVMRWRAGQYQPVVNGGQAAIIDPADATVRTFFKNDTIYFAFDVRDGAVQYYPLEDRWDGVRVSITDRSVRGVDRNLAGRAISFIVGPTGQEMPMEYLPFLRDTAQGARIKLRLKPGTTVDTTGTDVDAGWTAELAVDLTKLNYPTGLGDGLLWLGITLFDGDSFLNFSDSYGTRAWWGRERENLCCGASAYMDPNQFVVGVGRPDGGAGARLLGNFPNPFGQLTVLRFALPAASRVSLDVFDLQGRKVATRALGTLSPGTQQATFARGTLGPGLYLYRLSLADPSTGTARGTMSGKMMVLQ